MICRWIQVFVGVISMTLSWEARGESESIVLRYSTRASCPPRAQFVDEVRARTSKVRFAGADGARRFSVAFSRSEDEFTGKLEIVSGEGETSERVITGRDCDEVASGLALVLALAVDPDASTAPIGELPPPPAPGPESTPAAAPAVAPVKRPPQPQSQGPQLDTPRRSLPSSPGKVASTSIGLGLDATLIAGITPKPLAAAGTHLRVSDTSFGLKPRGTLRFFAAKTGTVGSEGELADYRVIGGQLDLCPHRFALLDALETGSCVVLQGAALRAEGRDAPKPGAATRAFFASGLSGFLSSQLGGDFYAEFQAAGWLNLTRDDFVFEQPRVVVHDVPLFSFSAGISVGLAVL